MAKQENPNNLSLTTLRKRIKSYDKKMRSFKYGSSSYRRWKQKKNYYYMTYNKKGGKLNDSEIIGDRLSRSQRLSGVKTPRYYKKKK